MDSFTGAFPERALSRRRFGWMVGAGAVLLVAGGTYGVVSGTELGSVTSAATAFGTVSVLRAGRFARLDAEGRPATGNLSSAVSKITGGANMVRGNAGRATGGTASTFDHDHGGALLDQGWPQPVNLTWGDVVMVEVELHNGGPQPVLFSPGQLRLRLAPSGTTVTPQDSDRSLDVLEPNAMERILISYLAPHDSAGLELEYSDAQMDQLVRLALPPVVTGEAGP